MGVINFFTLLLRFHLFLYVVNSKRSDNSKKKEMTDFISRNNETEFEIALRHLERVRFNEAIKIAKVQGKSIRGFYHTSTWRDHWSEVIEEQLRIMDGSRLKNFLVADKWSGRYWVSLLEVIDQLHFTVAGSANDYEKVKNLVKSLKLKWDNKINIMHSKTMERDLYRFSKSEEKKKLLRIQSQKENLTEGEFATVHSLYLYCKNEVSLGRQALVYYVHNKGACCPKGENHPIAEWREEMNTFILEFPSICMRALLQGYSGCGVEYGDGHYSGNFWWADCDHVAALPGLWDPINNAYACELFLYNVSRNIDTRFKFAKNCGYSPFHCKVNHYVGRCPREMYLPKILEYLAKHDLPMNPTSTINSSTSWAKDYCTKLYKEQPYYTKKSWNSF